LWPQIEERILPTTSQYGLGNVVWSPMAMGVLSGKYTDASAPPAGTRAAGPAAGMMGTFFKQPILDAVQKALPIASEAGVSLAQLSLAWCLRKPQISSVIFGATKVEHVDANVAAGNLDIDGSVFTQLEAVLEPVAQRPVPKEYA
jgi:aryl-alcohol dehydrogenase-like predicted oxidoreductase